MSAAGARGWGEPPWDYFAPLSRNNYTIFIYQLFDNKSADLRVAMELSSIGDQVFAVESITKKRVRKVRLLLRPTLPASRRLPQLLSVCVDPSRERWSSRILVPPSPSWRTETRLRSFSTRPLTSDTCTQRRSVKRAKVR